MVQSVNAAVTFPTTFSPSTSISTSDLLEFGCSPFAATSDNKFLAIKHDATGMIGFLRISWYRYLVGAESVGVLTVHDGELETTPGGGVKMRVLPAADATATYQSIGRFFSIATDAYNSPIPNVVPKFFRNHRAHRLVDEPNGQLL